MGLDAYPIRLLFIALFGEISGKRWCYMSFKSKDFDIWKERKKAIFLREISSFIQRIALDEPDVQNVFVTRVEISGDAGICNVFFSGKDGEASFLKALEILKLYKPSMRRLLGKKMRLKYTPEIIFKFDEKYKKIERMERILGEIGEELKQIEEKDKE